MKITFIVLLALQTTSLLASASDQCRALPLQPQYSDNVPPQEGCTCGSSLKNVIVTLNKNYKIGAVCGLRWSGLDGDLPIDLKINSTSLDNYTDGKLPLGQILLIGHSTLTGSLKYSPGNAGDLWFAPKGHPIAVPGTAFSQEVGQLKLARPYNPAEFHVPRALWSSCWSARATVSVSNIWVTIGSNDQAGAYPARYRVISIVNHKSMPCD